MLMLIFCEIVTIILPSLYTKIISINLKWLVWGHWYLCKNIPSSTYPWEPNLGQHRGLCWLMNEDNLFLQRRNFVISEILEPAQMTYIITKMVHLVRSIISVGETTSSLLVVQFYYKTHKQSISISFYFCNYFTTIPCFIILKQASSKML